MTNDQRSGIRLERRSPTPGTAKVDEVDEQLDGGDGGDDRPSRRAVQGTVCSSSPPDRERSARHGRELAGPTGEVVVSDIAPGMVEIARRRNAGLANVEVATIDATAINWPDSSFDVVVVTDGADVHPRAGGSLRRDPSRPRTQRSIRRPHLGRPRAQPVADVRRHGGDGQRSRRRRPPWGRAASSRSAIRASSSH